MVSRCNGFVAATYIYSLIFAVIWTILPVIGFMIRDCSITVSHRNPAIILIVVYFYDECNRPDWWKIPDNVPSYVDVDLPLPSVSKRTTGVLYWYSVSSACRVVAALMAFTVMIFGCKMNSSSRALLFGWLWVAVAAAGLIGDLACSIIYAMEIGHTQTIYDLTGIDIDISVVQNELMLLKLLPVLMMLFCSRFIIFWLLEFILLLMAAISLKRQHNEQKAQDTKPRVEPWTQLTNAAGVDKVPKAGGGVDMVGRKPPSDGGSSVSEPRPTTQYYAEPYSPGLNQQSSGSQDVSNQGSGPVGAYMASPVNDRASYRPKPSTDIYAQPWSGGRPIRPPVVPINSNVVASHPRNWEFEPPSPEGRLGDWDPRSPIPSSDRPSFFGNGQPFTPQQQQHQQQQRPSTLSSFQPAPPGHQPPGQQPPGAANERGRRDPREPLRYVQKLRDVEAEELAQQAAAEAEARFREDERVANERRQVNAALQEMTAKANAMEASRSKRLEADGTVRKRGPPPPPPARRQRPEELQNQTPWSYVGPALSGPLPVQRNRGTDNDDEDDRPIVPVPDYTLHIKRHNDRPTLETN